MENKFIVEVWDSRYGYDGKTIKEVKFSSFDEALSYAERINTDAYNPCTIWECGCRVMDIG
jgi:hypothetical protein